MAKTELYLFITVNDVEPVIRGPYTSEEARDRAARRYQSKKIEDGLFRLNITDGKPTTEAYSGAFFD